MKSKHIEMYFGMAEVAAKSSTAEKLKVGSIAVKDHRILSVGYNGTPSGTDNVCEHKIFKLSSDGTKAVTTSTAFDIEYPNKLQVSKHHDTWFEYRLETKKDVIHAEMNLIYKMARDGAKGKGADIFITHAPCFECAKAILSVGFNSVYYRHQYRNTDGVDFLKANNVKVYNG